MITEAAIFCLAANIFFEARSEGLEGQYAVALVTINRSVNRDLSICKTVFQHRQFSWTIGATDAKGHLLPSYRSQLKGSQWAVAKMIAGYTLNGNVIDFTNGANYYYADYIPIPVWLVGAEFKGKWGRHYFYRKEY